jgi:hypothetical protein
MTVSMDECKKVIAETIAEQLAQGVRKANIEIDLIFFIKREIYKD